jgi:hypothetical protein
MGDETQRTQVRSFQVQVLQRSHFSSTNDHRRFIFADIEASQADEILQCEWGYFPCPEENCEKCQEKRTCLECRKCRHCLKSHCGRSRHSLVLAVCQTACEKCECHDVTPQSICEVCGDRCIQYKKTKCFIKPPCAGKCGFRERVFQTLYELGSWIFHEKH